MNKLFLPYDIYERHREIGSLIGKNKTVLDIGGELGHLDKFCKPKKIVVANLNTGDVIIKKNTLPFKKNSFDIVCAIDVLEHIPKKDRRQFVQRLIDVASSKVILSFPISSKRHLEYEKETLEWLKKHGQNIDYLKEHVRLGLPTINEIKTITKSYKNKISFSGNIAINRIIFKFYMFDPKLKGVRKLTYILKHLAYLSTNQILYVGLTNKHFSENVNRAYVTVYKK